MISISKIFCLVILFLCIVQYEAKPTEVNILAESSEEMMETAEAQNPFLPRFAMKALRDRRERARAQRRNFAAQRRYQPYRGSGRC